MNTYTETKTLIICPHCNARTDSSIDHLSAEMSFGPWYCDECGGGYKGIANGTNTILEKVNSRFSKVLDLLVLNPQKEALFFVISNKRFYENEHDVEGGEKYFYEEHSCPANWIRDTKMIVNGNDKDPHGLFKFICSVNDPCIADDNLEKEEDFIMERFFKNGLIDAK